MKKNINVNIIDLRNFIKDKQYEMKTIIKEKYSGYEKMVIKAITGGIYVGLLGKGPKKLQEEYKTDSIVGLMDCNLLKTYYETTCEIVQLLKNTYYVVSEHGADEEIYYISKNISFKHRDKFKKDNKLSPKNYLNDISKKRRKEVQEGIITIDMEKYSSVQPSLKFNLALLKSEKINSNDLDLLCDKFKKELQNLMIKRYQNEKGYGELTGKIYNSFYGFKAEEIKSILKEQGIKAKSVISVLNNNHKLYLAAILKTCLEYMQIVNNEHQLRIITSLLGVAAKEEFIKENNATPLHNLVISNRYINEEEPTSKQEENHQVRVRKKGMSELNLERKYEYEQ